MPPTDTTSHDRRRLRRKSVKRGTTVCLRKGTLGLGRDLAIALCDLSHEGAQLRIKEQLAPKAEVEVIITGVGMSKPVVRLGTIAWCVLDDVGFRAGVSFRVRLDSSELFNLT